MGGGRSGGGTLDAKELKQALKTLQEKAAGEDEEVAHLKLTTVELCKVAKAAQVELKQQQKADDAAHAERARVAEAEAQAKYFRDKEARERKLAAQAEKKAAAEAEKRAFEQRVIAARAANAAKYEQEYYSPPAAGGSP